MLIMMMVMIMTYLKCLMVQELMMMMKLIMTTHLRCLMVQKAVQYAYVAKCLSFMVST